MLGGKWRVVVLARIKEGARRYADLRRLVPRMSEKMLTQRLRELVDAGLVTRSAGGLRAHAPLLAPVFARMSAEHPKHVAQFLAEVLGGPATYSAERGGHPNMIRHHLSRGLTQPQRRRWIELLLACGDEIGLPDDPEFRSALVAYLEWGTRLAVLNSQPGAEVVEDAPMPRWGWGEVRGPYVPNG